MELLWSNLQQVEQMNLALTWNLHTRGSSQWPCLQVPVLSSLEWKPHQLPGHSQVSVFTLGLFHTSQGQLCFGPEGWRIPVNIESRVLQLSASRCYKTTLDVLADKWGSCHQPCRNMMLTVSPLYLPELHNLTKDGSFYLLKQNNKLWCLMTAGPGKKRSRPIYSSHCMLPEKCSKGHLNTCCVCFCYKEHKCHLPTCWAALRGEKRGPITVLWVQTTGAPTQRHAGWKCADVIGLFVKC